MVKHITAMTKEDLEKRVSEAINLFSESAFEKSIEVLVPLHLELNRLLEPYEVSEKHSIRLNEKEKEMEKFLIKEKEQVLSKIYELEKNEFLKAKIMGTYKKCNLWY